MTARTVPFMAILALAPLFRAQEQQRGARPGPQSAEIRVTTELIQIRAVVTDRNGKPVDGLSQADFLLSEDGLPQPLAFFSLERVPSPRKSEAPGGAKPPAESKGNAGFSAEPGPIARNLVFLVDDLHTSFEGLGRVRAALHRFVNELMTDQDIVLLKTTTGQLGAFEQFTRNREVLGRAIDRILPWRVGSESLLTPWLAGSMLREDPAAIALGALIWEMEEGLLQTGAALPSLYVRRRLESVSEKLAKAKARLILAEARYQRLVVVSTAAAVVDRLSEMPGQRLVAMFSDGFTTAGPGGENAVADLHPVLSRAAESGVVFDTFDANGLSVPMVTASQLGGGALAYQGAIEQADALVSYVNASAADLTVGLSVLASETGGAFFTNSNDLSGGLGAMLDDNSLRYELAYYPPAGKDPGKTRTIAVAVRNHPDYKIRAQKSYILSDLRKSRPGPKPQTGRGRLHQAMSEPIPATEIGVTASARIDAKQSRLEVWIRGEDLRFESEGERSILDVEVETVVFDGQGETVKATREPLRRPLSKDEILKLREKELQYVSRLNLKRGVYHVRIGVRDLSSDRIGTAIVWLEIPKAGKGPGARPD